MNYEVIIPDQAQISGPLEAYRFRISDFGMRSTWTLEKNETMTKFPSCPRAPDWTMGHKKVRSLVDLV